MREILVLQLGGFGNRMGEKFWQELQKDSNFNNEEGKMNPLQVTENNTYYNLNETQPLPRCVQVDIGQEIPISNLNFNPCNQFSFNYSTGNNYGSVKNNCSSGIQDIVMDSIRSEVEICDSFQGFQFFHSIIGGAGSGLSSIMSEALNQEYGQKLIQSNILAPSIKLNDSCVVAPYNAILSFHSFFQQVQQIILFDNQGLDCNLKRQGEKYYEFDDINTLIAQTVCCNSSPFRRAGDINSSLQKLINNLIPFPRMSVHTCAVTNNQFSDYFKQYLKMNESQVLREIMSNNHNLNSNDLSKGKLITAALSLRGNISNEVIDREKFLLEMFYKYHRCYSTNRQKKKLEWLNLFFTNICKKQYSNYEYFGSSILNSTSIIESLKSLCEKFEKMIIKKTFMHKYCQEGIEQNEFDDAKSCITDLISEYQSLGEDSDCCENEGEYWE